MAVHGSGPLSDFMVVGNAPNYRDVRAGAVFSGPTGDEVRRLLVGCGLTGRAFLTNIWREQQDDEDSANNARLYDEGVLALREELRRVRPRHIITLGRDAARLFLGDVDMDECWGLHLLPDAEAWTRLPELRRDATILPQTHPAAGFHIPEASSQVLVGFENLRRVLQKKLPALGLYDDPKPHPVYTVLSTAAAVAAWMQGVDYVAMDTEGYLHAPWSIQLSKQAGSAVLVRANNVETMHELRLWMPRVKTVSMHAGLHDLRVLRVMGIDLVGMGTVIEDTQLMAFLLGVIPQGLKPLSTRELRMRMQSYQEVLGDAQNRHATTYLQWLWDELHAEWEAQCVEDFGFQRDVLKRRIKVVPKLPRSQLFKSVERVMRSSDPARLWGDQILDLRVDAHRRLGAMPEASLSDVEPDIALRYAARDADATYRLRDILRPRITDMQLESVYQLDLATYPIVDRMMQVGIRPDVEAFGILATKLDGEISTLRQSLQQVTGHGDFNPNSGDQVAAYLFDELRLEPLGKRTSSGRESTNDKVLEALEKYYQKDFPQIADIRAYREYYKLQNTFVLRLPELIHRWPRDERIHCDLFMNRIPSGRLNARNPNLLAMPKHGKFAKDFRRCFVPGPGRLFLSADESQAELRVLAHLSQDPVMLAIFRGEKRNRDGSTIDLHAMMAERIFGVPPKLQDGSKHRLPAKAVNFGLPMGMTAVGLCLELRKGGLDVREDDAQRWIDEADALYTQVPIYKARCIAEAEQNGYVRCLSGRIRYIGGIRSRDDRVKSEAERFAFSTPVQEGAQWIGKHALAAAWNDIFVPLQKAGHWCEPLLWTHDDLLSEMEDELVLTVAPQIRTILSTAPAGFTVPLETAPEAGLNWAEMVPV